MDCEHFGQIFAEYSNGWGITNGLYCDVNCFFFLLRIPYHDKTELPFAYTSQWWFIPTGGSSPMSAAENFTISFEMHDCRKWILPYNFYSFFQNCMSFLWNSARTFSSVIQNVTALTRGYATSPKLLNSQHTNWLRGLHEMVVHRGFKTFRRRAVNLNITCFWVPKVLNEMCVCAQAEGRRNNKKCWGMLEELIDIHCCSGGNVIYWDVQSNIPVWGISWFIFLCIYYRA